MITYLNLNAALEAMADAWTDRHFFPEFFSPTGVDSWVTESIGELRRALHAYGEQHVFERDDLSADALELLWASASLQDVTDLVAGYYRKRVEGIDVVVQCGCFSAEQFLKYLCIAGMKEQEALELAKSLPWNVISNSL